MSEKKKVTIVNLITGSRILGTFLLPVITSIFGPVGTAVYIGTLWATDAIDGYLAKHKWKVSTIFGANLDAFSDKVFGISVLIYLSSFYPFMIIPLISEFVIFGVNWHYGKKGSNVKSSKIGKCKTALLGVTTALSILSTISLTSGLSLIIPSLIGFISIADAITLGDYIHKNQKYLRTHEPKNDVSHLGFFETIKTIIKKLGDKNLYSPAYYKEHKNEPLLDMLLNNQEDSKEEIVATAKVDNNDIREDNTTCLTISEQNELKIKYNLSDKDIEVLDGYVKFHNMKLDEIKKLLDYIFIKETNKNEVTEDTPEKLKNKKK